MRCTLPHMLGKLRVWAERTHAIANNFDLAKLSASGHYGLLGISERIALLGGRLKLQNRPGGGLLLAACRRDKDINNLKGCLQPE